MTKQGNRAREEGAENGGSKFIFRSPVVTTCLVVIALCVGGYTFSYLKAVLSPLLIALFIFFLTNPIVRYFQARNFSPAYSYFLVLLLTVATFLSFGFVIFGNVQDINERMGNYEGRINGVVDRISMPIMQTLKFLGLSPEDDKGAKERPNEPEKNENENQKEESSSTTEPEKKENEGAGQDRKSGTAAKDSNKTTAQSKGPPQNGPLQAKQEFLFMLRELFKQVSGEFLNQVIGTSLEYLEISLMTIFYLFFILVEAHKLPNRIKRGFAYESTQNLMDMGVSIQRSIEQYLRVKTGVSFGLGVTTGLIGMMFGLDFWLLWAGFMFISNYVTYIGSMVALVPPIAIGFLQFESMPGAIALAILLVANRFFWIDYAEIKFSGQQLNVSPVILLLSIGLFGALWGVIGMVLAVPVVTSVKIALSKFDSTSHLASLLSED